MSDTPLSKLQKFKYANDGTKPIKVTKPAIKPRTKTTPNLPDLRQSLNNHVKVLFIGFNPGKESSIQQHHYAHHSNLFWKLFNQSKVLQKVVDCEGFEKTTELSKLLNQGCSAKDDFELIKYNIGFTDLVLRCTSRADELTTIEKLDNVPRLLKEFKESNVENIVVIGKGIWEIIVKYFVKELKLANVKLNKEVFEWGLQSEDCSSDKNYNLIIESIYKNHLPSLTTKLYVFPNTSGLVGSLKYSEKLELWENMVSNI
ncbi:mug G/U mismatch-specific DNA glycosylase [Candida maltosa Xu316]|uniref:Uracil-DNA glycosylase-like domain-containing protein n=1 Tax=Candida maltosa (strain Xu316) TaxID=1245528 RepID=M3HE21_CANMX|nr:hypothetical protein G210_4352 [Candida maltosa Xu316]